MKKPLIIGIAGGSGSGKSTVTEELFSRIDPSRIAVISQDSYYKEQTNVPYEERIKTNYDHPLAFDNALLVEHLDELLAGRSIEKPIYDFEQHNRKKETETVEPREILILEGILILSEEILRERMDIKVFVDTDSDVRIIRRILRDMKERGRSLESVILQYMSSVRPAHLQFVEPSKRYADIIIPEGGYNSVAIDLLHAKLNAVLDGRHEEGENSEEA